MTETEKQVGTQAEVTGESFQEKTPMPRKRKIILICVAALIVIIVAVLLSSLLSKNSNPATDTSTGTSSGAVAEPTAAERAAERSTDEFVFGEGLLTSPDYMIDITEARVVESGAPGNEDGSWPVLVFRYTVYNHNSEDLDPLSAWKRAFKTSQSIDGKEEQLTVLQFDENHYRGTSSGIIPKDGSVENEVAVMVMNRPAPIVLTAIDPDGKTGGTQSFGPDWSALNTRQSNAQDNADSAQEE